MKEEITKENIDKRFNDILLGIDKKHKVVINLLYSTYEMGKHNKLSGDILLKFMLILIYDAQSEKLNQKIEATRNSTKGFYLYEDSVEEEQKEKQILLKWLTMLTRKIMKYNELKMLRGYPITSFIKKYLPNVINVVKKE